jgi:hypothetical protein
MFGLLPTLMALLIDKSENLYSSKIVAAWNLIAMLPYLALIIKVDEPDKAALDLIFTSKTWLILYSSAALGWLLYFITPMLALAIVGKIRDYKVEKIRAEMAKDVEEWGEGVKVSGKNEE